MDNHAGLPPGTSSFYFRTRKALLQATADRIIELDLADLSRMTELGDDSATEYTGTHGLARLVILSGTEPYLTRTRARFEIILAARHDDDLAHAMLAYQMRFYALARDVITQWTGEPSTPDATIDHLAVTVLTYISGVMSSFVYGYPVVSDPEHLDRNIRQILYGAAHEQD